MGYVAIGKSPETCFSSGGLRMSVRVAFVAMLNSGSDKLNTAFLQIFVACFSSPCVCGPVALIRLNSSQAIVRKVLCSV